MKTIIFSFTLLLFGFQSNAQSEKFTKGIQQNLALLDSAKTSDDYVKVAANFERMADAEKTQWLPYYYAALANIWRGFNDSKADYDEVGDKADALIVKAESIDSKNSEISVVKSMAATMHMMVDPMSRWQKYGMMQKEELERAKQIDVNNPRIYFLEGQSIFNMPEQFGGGKENAKPLFEKAVELFKSFKPVSNLYPNWGNKLAEQMLAKCKS